MFELTLNNRQIANEVFTYDKSITDEQISKDYEEWVKEKLLQIRGGYFEAVTWESV
jgi:hypothetical protein